MAALIAGYLLSSTCGTLVQGPRSSLLSSQSAAVPETRNPNGGPLCPLPSPPPVRPTVVFADAEEVGRALDDAGFLRRPATFLRCGSLLVTFSSRLLFHSFRGEGRNAVDSGRGERWEKRGRGREREKKRREKLVEISRRRKRGRGKERRKEVPRIDSEAANRKPRHRKSHFCGQSPLASVAYFDRIRESLERRGAISWRTCPDPFAAPTRRRLEEIETRGIY